MRVFLVLLRVLGLVANRDGPTGRASCGCCLPCGLERYGCSGLRLQRRLPPLPVLVLELALGVARGPTRKVRVSDKFG